MLSIWTGLAAIAHAEPDGLGVWVLREGVLMKLPGIVGAYFAPKKLARILCLRHKGSGES